MLIFNSFGPALALVALPAALVGAAAGIVWHRIWLGRKALAKRRIHHRWHLQARPLLTAAEHEVWHWLKRAFYDHHVVIKVPVTRFTSPRTIAEGEQFYDMLNGVYCTFTVCASDGTVIGCVDEPGSQGLRASRRDLKQKLFAECGIAYAVVRAGNLPTLSAMRAAFLGEIDLSADTSDHRPASHVNAQAEDDESFAQATVPGRLSDLQPVLPASQAAPGAPPETGAAATDALVAMAEARASLRAKLERNRRIRFTNFDPLSTGSGFAPDSMGPESDFGVQWRDSLMAPTEDLPDGKIAT